MLEENEKDKIIDNKFSTKVSIIIACYNVERYIVRCLDSLINQTLNEIEIICIDDGSTDSTLEIIKKYALKDKRIKYLSQVNQKQGAARNRGLEIATGEYTAFIDSDDFVELNYCEELYNTAKKYDADLAVCSMRREKGKKQKYFLHIKEEKLYTKLEHFLVILNQQYQACSKLFKTNIAKEISFPEGIFFEDDCYTIRFFAKSKKYVTVPTTFYHYVSNPSSTLKQKNLTIGLDRTEASLDVIKFARENNLQIPERLITKKSKGLWKIKYYIDREDYYFCGVKTFSKKVAFDDSKTFLVFNTACFGDVLLCNSLVQNIKNRYPKSKVIFICDKAFKNVARLQEGVDDVVIYDKKGTHKGFIGMLKFIKDFPYKNLFASFITYKNQRNWMVSKLLGVKYVFNGSVGEGLKTQYRHALMLKNISNKLVQNLPIKFNIPETISEEILNICAKNNNIISLCMTSKKDEKDMPAEVGAEIIKTLSEKGYKVAFVGTGEKAQKYSEYFKSLDLSFINLINKTSIIDLAYLLKKSNSVISVDTGTLHMACAVNAHAIAIFYDSEMAKIWGPDESIYNVDLLITNQNKHDITKVVKILNRKNGVCK